MLTYLPYETETLTETLACCRAAAEIGISCNTVHLLQHAPRLTSCAPIEFDPFLPFLTFLNFVPFVSLPDVARTVIIHCFFVGIQYIYIYRIQNLEFFLMVYCYCWNNEIRWMGRFKFGIRVFCLQYFFHTVCRVTNLILVIYNEWGIRVYFIVKDFVRIYDIMKIFVILSTAVVYALLEI